MPSDPKRPLTIIGAIGAPPNGYREAYYSFDGQISVKTRFFMSALATHRDAAHVIVLVTDTASKPFADLRMELQDGLEYRPVPLPEIKKEDSNQDWHAIDAVWQTVNQITDAIPYNSRLILDITNGYRSIPLLLLNVAQLLRVLRHVEIEDIYYGANDARDSQGIAPVIKLDLSLVLNDWAMAVTALTERGDFLQLAQVLRSKHNASILPEQHALISYLHDFADYLETLSDALDLQQIPQAMHTAYEARELIDIPIAYLREHHAFRDLLLKVREHLDPLAQQYALYTLKAPDGTLTYQYNLGKMPDTTSYLRHLLEIVKWCQKCHRLNTAYGLARELVVAAYMVDTWKVGITEIFTYDKAKVSSVPPVTRDRKEAEDHLNGSRNRQDQWQNIWIPLREARNASAHAGIGQAMPVSELKSRLATIITDLAKLMEGLP